MIRFERFLSCLHFKKIALVYIVAAVLAALGCAIAVGTLYRDRLSFAWQYFRLDRAVESGDTAALQSGIDRLAASGDVVDVLLLDANNQVLYSAKQSVYAGGQLNLSRVEGGGSYLVSDRSPQVVFRYVRKADFLLQSVFAFDWGDILEEYGDDAFYEGGFSQKNVCLLNYISDRDRGNKLYIISSPSAVPGGKTALKITACLAMLFFMIHWVLLALWTYQNAAKCRLHAPFWGIAVLLTNLVGVLIYQFYKHGNATCSHCGASQSRSHRYCAVCGTELGEACRACGLPLSARDHYCPRCGTKKNGGEE